MKPFSITITGTGTGATSSDPVRVNWRADETAAQLDTDGSTTAFTVEYTLTPPTGYATKAAWAAGAVWSASSISAATADEAGVISGSIQGVRVSASASGTDTATVWFSQPDR